MLRWSRVLRQIIMILDHINHLYDKLRDAFSCDGGWLGIFSNSPSFLSDGRTSRHYRSALIGAATDSKLTRHKVARNIKPSYLGCIARVLCDEVTVQSTRSGVS